jgi:hypothetical protein
LGRQTPLRGQKKTKGKAKSRGTKKKGNNILEENEENNRAFFLRNNYYCSFGDF